MTACVVRLRGEERMALTPRQLQVIRLLGETGSAQRVGDALGIREQTVQNHLAAAYRRLGVDNGFQAVLLVERGRFPRPLVLPGGACGWLCYCGRPVLHRGQHGGFRAAVR